ncbi:MAG: hypothetical protein H5T69_11965, partial [Chloroflexi bacterium]|nr:hypothetical protein [Chloroflexota bacterium]
LQDTGALRSESPVTDHLVRSALRQGRPVYYVLIDGNSTWRPYQWRFESVDARRFAVPTLRYAMGRPPSIEDVAEGSWIADVYRVQALGKMSGPQDVLDIPAGQGGSPYLYMGFYNWEMDARGELFRWTDGDARVTVPWPHTMREDYGDLCLRLDVSGWRPAGIRDAHLIVEVEGVRFYDAMLNRAAERQSIEIPVRAISNKSLRDLEIRLYSDSWNLGILKGEAESRRLGIMFYGLRIAPLKRCE